MRVSPFAPPAWRRVLLVEEDPRLRDVLGRAVREMGFDVRTAPSAEVALRILQEHPQDILVADYHLPGMGGAAFVQAVHESWPDIPGILLADFTELLVAKKAVRIDTFDFLPKPCALGELERGLEQARQRRVHMLPATPPVPEPQADEISDDPDEQGDDHATLEEIERRHILTTLERNHGNRTRTAAELGISLRKLYYRLGQYHREGLLPQ